jgi:hypothetical protein
VEMVCSGYVKVEALRSTGGGFRGSRSMVGVEEEVF